MTAGAQHAGASFATFAVRRLLGVAAVVVLTPSLTFVVLGSLRDGTMLWTQAAKLPR